ncbi:uncharacterized protein LOC108668256 [Hyalella azteca]|uniref:Uncharacterized protein LOC108668256 n=1 Tax=Hyalella azteca TaxID=294128 RepID=A0A979FWE6_HYAAZ|nr:uncharacterized protein LOC108668256 [Hyalella azteca]XP_047741584.1 uncharacterized protein LOC108668256 [Hyalella azteca]
MSPNPVIEFAFTNVQVGNGRCLTATCKFCTTGKKTVSFYQNSCGNLIRHLKRHHINAYRMYFNKYVKNKLSSVKPVIQFKSLTVASPNIETTSSITSRLPMHATSCTSSCNTIAPCGKTQLPQSTVSCDATQLQSSASSFDATQLPRSATSCDATQLPLSTNSFDATWLQGSATLCNATQLPCNKNFFDATQLQHSATSCYAIQLPHSAISFDATQLQCSAASCDATQLPWSKTSFEATQLQRSATSCAATQLPHSASSFDVTQLPHSATSCNANQLPHSAASFDTTLLPNEKILSTSELRLPHSTTSFVPPMVQIPTKVGKSSASARGTVGQMPICKPQCSACALLLCARKFYCASLQAALQECKHENDCCCKTMYNGFIIEACEETNLSKSIVTKKNDKSFVSQYDCEKDVFTHYCKVCLSHQNPLKHCKSGESWCDGMTFTETRSKNAAKKRHLLSVQHQEALKFSRCEDKQQMKLKRPTTDECKNATKNSMVAGIFMATNSLSFRLYPALCTLLAIICPPHLSHPLGNQHHTHTAVQNIMHANYRACAITMKNHFSQIFPATKSTRKFMISCDKGTAPKDVSRQVIVASYIADNGLPKEVLLCVSMLQQGDAMATTNHVKETVALFMEPSSVAFICTDKASVYTEEKGSLIDLLKASDGYHKLIGLPDFCHKVENLLNRTMPKWVSDTLTMCRSVVAFINDHNIVKNHVHNFINVVRGTTFTAIPNQCDTHFTEYLHYYLDAILKNIHILFQALPVLMNDANALGENAKRILKLVANESFVVRAMMIRQVYKTISSKEKLAKDSCFGPFDYKHQVESIKPDLNELKSLSPEIKSFLNDGNLKFISDTNYATDGHDVLLEEVISNLDLKTRNKVERSRDTVISLTEENSKWIEEICNEAPNYLVIPTPIRLATDLFSIHKNKHSASIKNLFDSVNIKFESCDDECKGFLECTCLENDYLKFMEIFRSEWQAGANNKLIKHGSETLQSYTEAFAHYISSNNDKSKYPVNIIRCLEIIQLMKPTLSATERVMSHVANTVHNLFDSKYVYKTEPDEKDLIDNVNNEVFLKCNTNMVQHDADLARTIFLSDNHRECLMKTKKCTVKSKTISNYIEELGSDVMKRNLPKQCLVLDQKKVGSKKRKIDSWLTKKSEHEVPSSSNSDSVLPSSTNEAAIVQPEEVIMHAST